MKITIIASGTGEKALFLYDFFKEGNRITVDSLITDTPASPLALSFEQDNIAIFSLDPEESGESAAATLKERGVELLVIDDYDRSLPDRLEEAYHNRIVRLTSREKAPMEVIEAVNKINAIPYPAQKEERAEEAPDKREAGEGTEINASPLEKEWAEVLNVDITSKATGEPETPVNEEIKVREVEEAPQAVQEQPIPRNTGFFNQWQPPQQPAMDSAREPMPPTYLVWSVIITILCCFPAGIVAIVFSALVSSRYYKGNIEGARRASRMAQIWCIVSIVAGIVWSTLYLPLSLLLG